MSNLKEKLIAIQKELKAPKNQFNKFGGYNYRSCEDILEAVKPLLQKHKVLMMITDEMVEVGGYSYVKATATIFDTESDEIHANSAWAREAMEKKGMDASQITGTASSYARKYCLNGLFLIDDTKDADTDEHAVQTGAKAVMASDKQVALILQLSKDTSTITSYYKVERLEDLTSKQASEVIGKLKGDK